MISILVSVYNQERYLDSFFQSISLSYNNDYELLLVDDCSTDNSRDLILKFLHDNDFCKLIDNDKNLGLPSSLNKAFSLSKNQYIARMDSDDLCCPERFSAQVRYLLDHPEIDILGSNADLIDLDSNIIGVTNVPLTHDEIVLALELRNPMIHPTVIMKRKVLDKLGGYDENLRKAQDLDLWHRAAKAGFKFANMSDSLIKYRVDLNKPIKTIVKGFVVSFSNAIRDRSIKGVFYSIVDLLKYFLIKIGLYTPRSLRKKI